MYTKIKDKVYKLIETDTADSAGVLYNSIWDLAWNLANKIDIEESNQYIQQYRGK